mgnify:CR=1 FL=1
MLRKQCGLTQEQLAELLQCSVQKVCFLATAGTAVGLWFVLANSIEGGTMCFIWFYVLLLFALSFFKGDSRQRNML